jgi:hypothetical protein
MRVFRGLIASFFLISGYSGVCFGSPTIAGVHNEVQPDATFISVVVDGLNLGERPNIVYYNDFRKELAFTSLSAGGQLAGTTRLRLGNVPMVSVYNSTPGFLAIDDTVDKLTIVEAFLGEAQSKVFLSYSVAIPEGYTAPASTEPKKWYEGSSWKLSWLLESPQAYSQSAEFDLCAPTMVGSNSALMGNSSLFVSVPSGFSYFHAKVSDWWAWDVFNHMQVVFSGDLEDPLRSTGSFSVVNSRIKYINFPHKSDTTAYKGPSPKITQINFPGWVRNTAEDNFQAIYSNIYVSAGDNFLSRVEITDSAEYTKSQYRRVVFPTEWTPTRIKFDIYKSEIKANTDIFMHYFDSNGIQVGGAHKVCTHCPMPVTPSSSPAVN